MSNDVPPVPYKTPLTDSNGILTLPWIGWFRQLFMRVGGNVGSVLINPMSTLGDMIYGGSSGTSTRLPGDLTDLKKFLRSQSIGGIATPPVWDLLQASDIPPLSYVTSVALTAPGILSVSGSPITSSGTLALTLSSQSPNMVFSGPSSGSGTPTFRLLVAADIPALAYVGSIAFSGPGGIFSIVGSPVTSSGTISQTVSGTSGGIPYFSNTSTLSSSALLASNQLVLGGGSGGAPSTLTAGSQYQVLIMGATTPGYGALAINQSAAVSGQLRAVNGGTGQDFSSSTGAISVSSGTFSAGTISVANGGTGNTTANGAINALLPTQAGNSGKYLFTDGSNANWNTVVTSVAMSVPSFLSVSGSPITTTGTLAVSLSGTALPVANGGTGVTSVTTSPTASSFAGWDANKNLSANALSPGLTSTATAAGTTTMTIASTETQVWTGSTTQTVKLPTTGVAAGARYFFINSSSGVVTVQSSGANTIQAMAANSFAIFNALVATPTTAANWSVSYSTNNAGGGTVTSVQVTGANGLSFSGGPITTSGTITATLKAPTVQRFTSGSGTYTAPSSPSPLWIKVTMSGGGGGGGGDSASGTNGITGGNTTFTSNLTSSGGGGGQANGSTPGTGGSNTVSATSGLTVVKNFQGGGGTIGGSIVSSGFTSSPVGGVNPFGGASTNLAGLVVSVNTGAGGAGGFHSGSTGASGSSGGAGGYLEVMISGAALSTIIASGASYSVGAAGGSGSGSSANGGNGAAGIIIVEEYYQ